MALAVAPSNGSALGGPQRRDLAPDAFTAIPDRATLRQAAQARDDFAQSVNLPDLGEAVRPTQPARHRLAKGVPNRNPDHERKRRAPGQQDADDNSAMPTAKFGTRKSFHWCTDTEGLDREGS